jgi:hypothetical protein
MSSIDRESWRALMEGDFSPQPDATTEHRMASALEYIAYQLGQINRKLTAEGPRPKPAKRGHVVR